jgi:hypothetical protein
MCIGYLGLNGTWQIRAKVHYNNTTPDIKLDFLIDTGAVKTVLSPKDAKLIGIDLGALEQYCGCLGGVGTEGAKHGKLALVLPNSGIEFTERAARGELINHLEKCEDGILIGDPDGWDVESLIGLDIINRFNLFINLRRKQIKLSKIRY